jgi:hypothetical protein
LTWVLTSLGARGRTPRLAGGPEQEEPSAPRGGSGDRRKRGRGPDRRRVEVEAAAAAEREREGRKEGRGGGGGNQIMRAKEKEGIFGEVGRGERVGSRARGALVAVRSASGR